MDAAPHSLYVHVPFCARKCAYCDFYSIAHEPGLAGAFTDAARAEARLRASAGQPALQTLYVGGGTPTTLGLGLASLLSALVDTFGLAPGAEVTVEANPGSVDASLLDALARAGATRVSLGVQAMDDPALAALGRVHTLHEAREAARAVREAGLALSVDLIFALPAQTVDAWRSTLQRAVRELEPGHVSAYELSLEPGTPMHRAVERGDLALPSEDEAARMFVAAHEELARLGFEHYEISNYARPGERSRHNANYWARGAYLALGPSAHGFDGRERWWNVPDVGQYVRLVGSGRLPEAGRASVSEVEAAREWLMLGLRTADGLSLGEARAHGLDGLEEAARPLADDGLLAVGGGRVRPTLGGMLLSNALAVRLMERLGL